MKKIIVTIPMSEEQRRRFEQQMPQAEYLYISATELVQEQLAQANIIFGHLPPERLAEAKQLEWLQLDIAGAAEYTKPGVLPNGVKLTNATGAYGLALSEWMLAQTFFLKKKLGLYHTNQLHAKWKDEGQVTAIQNSTTLVVGLGDTGGQYAKKMALLGSHVYGIRRHMAPCPDYLEGLGTLEELDRWLPMADIVALALPDTPQTQKLFGDERLSRMKPGSILLNVGRGTAVDSDALYEALQRGPLWGAALDVTDPEPLPGEHPLWTCPNLLLTPHAAGNNHLPETMEQVVELFVRNLKHFAEGQPLENPVDMQTGYRVTML